MDLMSITQLLGNLGEFLSAIVVFFSLIYLVVQVRRNTQQLESNEQALLRAESTAQHQQYSGWRKMQINDPQLIAVWLKGIEDFEGLDQVEQEQFDYLATELLYVITNVWERYEAGVDPVGAWDVGLRTAKAVTGSAGGASWWRKNTTNFYPQFVKAIEG